MTDNQSSDLNTCEDWLLIEDCSSSSNLEQNYSECIPVSDTQAVLSDDFYSFENSSEDREQIISLNSGVENVDITEDGDDDFLDCNSSNLDPLGDEDVFFTQPTVRCYKHNRNERWNFMLNLIVAITISTAFAFSSGHFLGWSQKCTEIDRKFSASKMFQNLDGIMRNKLMEQLSGETQRRLPSQNVWIEIPGLQSDYEDKLLVEKMCFERQNHTEKCFPKMLPLNSIITEPTPLSPELKAKLWRNHFQNSSVYEQIILHPNNATGSPKNRELLFNESSINSHNFGKEEKSIFNFAILKEFHDEIKFDTRNSNYIIDNLKQDFKHILNLLSNMSVAFLSKTVQSSFKQSNTDVEMISEFYDSFETNLNSKLSDLQKLMNFSSNTNSKYFKKQILNLLGAVDSLLKTNTKVLKKYYGKFNLQKFSKSISKIVYNLENKWNKNSKFYKDKDNELNYKKSGKPTRKFAKQDKKKPQYFKNSHKYTYKSKYFSKKI